MLCSYYYNDFIVIWNLITMNGKYIFFNTIFKKFRKLAVQLFSQNLEMTLMGSQSMKTISIEDSKHVFKKISCTINLKG